MTKIMLVEDDKSLREIYGVRLLAEGYDIVSAGDGEEALAMAIKERPQLIISDVMMPKISGFDLLDILRSTTETRNIRVIMMTALSSENQRQRGEQLGADRYLVKSQVGIEDVVRVVHEVLGDQQAADPGTPQAPTPAAVSPAAAAPPSAPAAPSPQAGSNPLPIPGSLAPQPAVPLTPAVAPPQAQVPPPSASAESIPLPQSTPALQSPQSQPVAKTTSRPIMTSGAAAMPPVNPLPQPAGKLPEPMKPLQAKSRVIQPINDPTARSVNLDELLGKEMAKEAGINPANAPEVNSTAETQAEINTQIQQFASNPVASPTPIENIPVVSIDNSGIATSSADITAAPSLPTPAPAPTAPTAPQADTPQ